MPDIILVLLPERSHIPVLAEEHPASGSAHLPILQRSLTPKLLTLDHVVRRSRGGAGTWENLVAACYVCNNRKADRTPAEAGMPLIRKPAPIGIHAKHQLMIGDMSAWDKYLFCLRFGRVAEWIQAPVF